MVAARTRAAGIMVVSSVRREPVSLDVGGLEARLGLVLTSTGIETPKWARSVALIDAASS